jgi:peptidoglycan/LPS O-acetylase OafA/YrhL
MVHAALLLLMPEAVSTDLVFTISLKRSTQNLQLSTSWPADYPIFYLTQGYFDISGIEKPLLHTWTLSVEEQFYFVAPVLLLAIFRLGGRRFGHLAILIGLLLGAVSLIGAITEATSSGRNAAFYLPQWRGWEFLAGGFIGGQLVAAVGRLPRMAVETTAWLGAACIALAIGTFSRSMLYPSWHAVIPATGAALVILCGVARPENTVARLLALRGMVMIGLVSYAWYLWHWPILSYMCFVRVGEPSLLFDTLGGGMLAFALACMSYLFIERPIGRWRKTRGRIKNPDRLVLGFGAAGVAIALIGLGTALVGYRSSESFLAAHYGIEGKGVLDNGCDSKTGFGEYCFEGPLGIILGDSHATVLTGTFAKRFDALGTRLVSMARGSCNAQLLSPSQRKLNRRDDCAILIAPYERLIRRSSPVSFAIISALWSSGSDAERLLSDTISEFDPQTRVLLIGPVPMFPNSSLECVVLSDRYQGSRDHCVVPRGEFELFWKAAVAMLQSMPRKFPNVRYVDPIDLFCDQTSCRPFRSNEVLYLDSHHLSPAGADLLFDSFRSDFLWLAGKG